MLPEFQTAPRPSDKTEAIAPRLGGVGLGDVDSAPSPSVAPSVPPLPGQQPGREVVANTERSGGSNIVHSQLQQRAFTKVGDLAVFGDVTLFEGEIPFAERPDRDTDLERYHI